MVVKVGISEAKSSCVEVDNEPVIPGKWKGYGGYLRVSLQSYSPFSTPIRLRDFLSKYKNELEKIDVNESFYTRANTVAQKYIAKIPNQVLSLLCDYIRQQNNILFENIQCENDTDIEISELSPARAQTTIDRIIRDTKIIRELKAIYHDMCQICGVKLKLPNGSYYSEGHHLKKLGGIHKGPDIKSNIIILCPNHHTEFDFGMIAIKNDRVIHMDETDTYNGKELAYTRNDLSEEYLRYHIKHIFAK